MAYERFANGGLSSLAAGINDAVTSLTVKSAVGFPTGGNFRIVIDNEIMLVTDVQGKVFTVTRALEGTSAASHDADASVFHIITAGALAQRDIEQFGTGAIANRDAAGQAGRLYLPTDGLLQLDNGLTWDMLPFNRLTPPTVASFTGGWINQGSATAADSKGMLVMTAPSSASSDSLHLLVKAAPATPYKITVALLIQSPLYVSQQTTPQQGICFRESGSGKLLTYGWGTSNYPLYFMCAQWTNPTTFGSNTFQYGTPPMSPLWVRFGDDGANRTVEISSDGVSFAPVQPSQGRTVYLTADQVGIFVNNWKSSYGIPRVMSVLHWREA